MIVCVCRGVSDRTIAAAITAGARTLEDVARATGAGTGCGCCRGALEAQLHAAAACASPPCPGCPRDPAAGVRNSGGAPGGLAAKNDEAAPSRAA